MSLSRSPSPRPNGGWRSKGLTDNDRSHQLSVFDSKGGDSIGTGTGTSSRARSPFRGVTDAHHDLQWSAVKVRSEAVRTGRSMGPTIQTKNEGFFQRSRRKISSTLPLFNRKPSSRIGSNHDWREAEKLGRGRWYPGGSGKLSTVRTFVGNLLRRFKIVWVLLAVGIAVTVLMSKIHATRRYRASSHFGGGSKFVIILAANEGGGVMDWKGPREWAIERDSLRNKRRYAERWGYHLEVADLSTKKRYAHEWRESWEKVDIIRTTMAKYPKAEWFWWLDLNTFIMEPSFSLQQHIFNDLGSYISRDINYFNPLKIAHPPTSEFLDDVSRSPTGDNLTSSIDLILAQDCSGFNLGSFFVRRSAWVDRLLDIWWDPVLYEQKHMQWEHKEQDALEHIYTSQPYFRTHVGFIEQRRINSFPLAACRSNDEAGEAKAHPQYHYNQRDRDFLVNMAGCTWGRDCWAEMYAFRELSNKLNRTRWEKFKDGISDFLKGIWRKFFPAAKGLEDSDAAATDQDGDENQGEPKAAKGD